MKRSNRAIKICAVFAVVAVLNFSVSDYSYAQVDMVPGGAVGTSGTAAVEEDLEQVLPGQGNVTVNFKDVEIKTILHYLSEVSGVDIVPSPGVEGTVTMRLRNKPWEVALDIVTRNYGYAYSRDDEQGIIRVIPKGVLQTEEPITVVIPLNYIIEGVEVSVGKDEEEESSMGQGISQLLEAVRSVILEGSGENVTFLPSANALVITAIPARITRIKDMVALVDKKTPQIMLEAKIVEVTLDRNDQFGVDWNAVISASGAARPTTFPFRRDGTFGLSEKEKDYYPYATDSGGASRTDVVDFPYPDFSSLPDPTGSTGGMFSYGILNFTSFSAVLRMIDERDDTNILSSPRITTLNNQPAVIKVVTNLFLMKEQKTGDTGASTSIEFETKPREIGVILEVVPHVNDNGEITIDLKPQVSSNLSFTELTVVAGLTTVAMQYSLREADTQVMVKDGETIFIGGLITETASKEEHKFPVLGDIFGEIPLLGSLFKYEQDNIDKTEVVFFVTVHLLKDGMQSIEKSQTIPQYIKCYPEKIKKDKEVPKPIVKTGRLINEKKSVSISTVSKKDEVAGNKKKRKPILDFRKKK